MIEIIGSALYQWDVDRAVTATGVTHVHLANKGDSQAVVVELKDGQATIPNYLLQSGKTLFVYAVKDGITLESKAFSVKYRERPAHYVYEDDTRNYIYKLIQDAEDATEAANQVANDLLDAKERGDFNGPPGEPGAPGSALIDDGAVRSDASWSSLNIIGKMGHSLKKSALVVQTYPVAGTKIKVSASLPSGATHLKLYVTGKKLFNAIWNPGGNDAAYTMDQGSIYWRNGNTSNTDTSLRSRPVPVAHLVGKAINIAGAYVGGTNPGYAFYKADQSYLTGSNKGAFVVPEGAVELRFTILKSNITVNGKLDLNLIQMETGLQSDIEEYKELVFEPVSGDIVLEQEMLPGYNTIYAYAGVVESGVFKPTTAVPVAVECVENPVAETWRLKESIAQFMFKE